MLQCTFVGKDTQKVMRMREALLPKIAWFCMEALLFALFGLICRQLIKLSVRNVDTDGAFSRSALASHVSIELGSIPDGAGYFLATAVREV
jgi:hypothetical protein